jgi:hypothetical protein
MHVASTQIKSQQQRKTSVSKEYSAIRNIITTTKEMLRSQVPLNPTSFPGFPMNTPE